MDLGQHITLKLVNQAVIAETVERRRLLARAVLRIARHDRLLAFGQADNHLHLETAGSRAEAGKLTHRLEVSLRRQLTLQVSFAEPHYEPIRTARHLFNAFKYVLRQTERHGLDWDPRREACSLPDLLGLRLLGNYTVELVRSLLPRINRGVLLELLGVPALEPLPQPPLEELLEATLAATGLVRLEGSRHEAVEARRAAIEVAGGRLAPTQLASLLGISTRRLHSMTSTPPRPALVDAIRRQLHLLQQLGGVVALRPSFLAQRER